MTGRPEKPSNCGSLDHIFGRQWAPGKQRGQGKLWFASKFGGWLPGAEWESVPSNKPGPLSAQGGEGCLKMSVWSVPSDRNRPGFA